MHDINRVVLVGRLTTRPRAALAAVRDGASATCASRATRASKEPDGEYGERPNFFDVAVFGPPGENVATYMSRGSRVCVDGRLSWREWETAERAETPERSASSPTRVQFLDPAGERDGDADALVGAAAGDGAAEPF